MNNEEFQMYDCIKGYAEDIESAAEKFKLYLRNHYDYIEEDPEDYIKLRRDLQDAYDDLLSQEEYWGGLPKWKRK